MTRSSFARAARLASLAAVWLAAGCDVDRSGDGAASVTQNVITGTVLYRERIALPPGATVEVRLEDVSRADAPADVIAKQTIEASGRQVPIPFELRYPRDRIVVSHRYGLRASILSPDGQLIFANESAQPVLEPPQASVSVEILVPRAGAAEVPPATASNVPGGSWRLVAIERPGAAQQPVAEDGRYTIEFAGGRYSGRADCNRYSGGYREPEPGHLAMSAGPATLAACPPESLSSEFLRAVSSVTAYEVRGEQLRLSYGDGGALVLVRDDPRAAAERQAGRRHDTSITTTGERA